MGVHWQVLVLKKNQSGPHLCGVTLGEWAWGGNVYT